MLDSQRCSLNLYKYIYEKNISLFYLKCVEFCQFPLKHKWPFASYFLRETTFENIKFLAKQIQRLFEGYCFESDITLHKLRVTEYYDYSPFKNYTILNQRKDPVECTVNKFNFF